MITKQQLGNTLWGWWKATRLLDDYAVAANTEMDREVIWLLQKEIGVSKPGWNDIRGRKSRRPIP